MKSKLFIIAGTILLICAIVSGGLYISGASSTARYDKLLNLGNKYLLEENYEQAIIAFDKAIKIEPKSVDARLGLAKAYVAVDRTDDAVAVLEEAIEIDPKRPEPYISLAEIYIARGELDKAIQILEAGMKNSGDASIAGTVRSQELK